MSLADARDVVWRPLYGPGVDPDLRPPTWSVIEAFTALAQEDPGAPAVHYFGRTTSRGEVASVSDEVARVLSGYGVSAGDRVAISLQNTPMFATTLLGVWRLGASVVPVNPMLRSAELGALLSDSGARVVVAHPSMADVIDAVNVTGPLVTLWCLPGDLAGDLPIPHSEGEALPAGEPSLLDRCRQLADAAGDALDLGPMPAPDDVALITYTSGTTGPSKGVVSTHANLAVQAVSYEQWFECDAETSVLTVAPLFHITGLGAHLALALGCGHPMVMTYRFEPRTVLALIDRYRPSYALGAITAFISLLDATPDSGTTLATVRTYFSGGAPVPTQVVDRFAEASSRYIHNIYGLTETTSACIATPLGVTAPVDPAYGALSVGIPMGGIRVTVVDDDGDQVEPGTPGELVIAGPQVASGYWNRLEETSSTFREDGVHTGDVGIMDEHGWVFVVDRKKDLVVVSGYKVWPRDVEELLYRHPAVAEAAVVGRPDDYQGEALHAHVTLRPGQSATGEEIRRWCRDQIAAYKVPSEVHISAELPKTATGKLLRRDLRDA